VLAAAPRLTRPFNTREPSAQEPELPVIDGEATIAPTLAAQRIKRHAFEYTPAAAENGEGNGSSERCEIDVIMAHPTV